MTDWKFDGNTDYGSHGSIRIAPLVRSTRRIYEQKFRSRCSHTWGTTSLNHSMPVEFDQSHEIMSQVSENNRINLNIFIFWFESFFLFSYYKNFFFVTLKQICVLLSKPAQFLYSTFKPAQFLYSTFKPAQLPFKLDSFP